MSKVEDLLLPAAIIAAAFTISKGIPLSVGGIEVAKIGGDSAQQKNTSITKVFWDTATAARDAVDQIINPPPTSFSDIPPTIAPAPVLGPGWAQREINKLNYWDVLK